MRYFLLLGVCGLPWISTAGSRALPLPQRFADPPAETRIIKIIHSWPDKAKSQDGLIKQLKGQGFGGVVCNVSFDDYLESELKWGAFTRAVHAAREQGMALWLYDEKGYPSANAGGLVLREHPEWEARGLLIADLECGSGAVTLDLPPGKLLLSAAFPVHQAQINIHEPIDLADKIQDGKLQWQAPAGQWHVMLITESALYEGTHAEMNLAAKIPYPNLLQPEPTARFLEVTHQRYAERLGRNLGRYFDATFTDEPSLMSLFLRPMPYRVLPWAPDLPVAFKKRHGYDLEPVLPALIAGAGGEGLKNRYHYWQTVGQLVADNFFGQIQRWCQQHDVPSGGHLLMEENLVNHVPLYGDFFGCARRLDAPSIDCLTSLPSQVPWKIARLLSSVAELEQKPLVMSETSDHSQHYRPPGDNRPRREVSEAEIRGTCNRLMVSGVNRITSYYSFAGLNNASLRRLNQWVGRCGLMLGGGQQVTDVAVIYPVESIWPKFSPARHQAGGSSAASNIEHVYRSAADSLFFGQQDFIFVDGRALAEARVESGVLVNGNHRWRVLVLPGVDTLPWSAWEKIAQFVEEGGVVIGLDALPANSEREFPSERVQALAVQLFDQASKEPTIKVNSMGGAGIFLPGGFESMLDSVVRGVLKPDVKISPPRSPVRVTHRRVSGQEVYFLINDGRKLWEGEVEFAASGNPEQWDPATGQVHPVDAAGPVHLRMEPFGAMIFRFGKALLPPRLSLSSGTLPGLVHRALPKADPILVQGEFVRGELKADVRNAREGRPAWRVSSILTKGQTDTYLFVRLLYPQLMDLSGVESLVFDTWVPEGQKTPNQLLMILHQKGGGDFLASSGRLLSAAGHHRTFIPLAQFQLAGWSKGSDDELDLTMVDEVRIGWGGYLGREGEHVDFSFAVPESAEVATLEELRE